MNLSSVQREVKNEHRRLELSLYIDYRLGSHPKLGAKSQLALRTIQSAYNFNSYNNNVKFKFQNSISMTMNICEVFRLINNTG